MVMSFIKTNESVTIYVDGGHHVVHSTHPNFKAVVEALKRKDEKAVIANLSIAKTITAQGKGRVYVKDRSVRFLNKNGLEEQVNNVVADRILTMLEEGFDINPMINFLDKVFNNPSTSAVEELWLFMEANNLTLHEDGDVLAYKAVRDDYKDCHSGTIDNSLGNRVSMERNKVDDRRNVTCSHGLHVCSLGYLNSFGGSRTLIVKVNPADFVSIPNDYNNQKARVCAYVVFDELQDRSTKYHTQSVYADSNYGSNTVEEVTDELTVNDVKVQVGYYNKRDALGRFTK